MGECYGNIRTLIMSNSAKKPKILAIVGPTASGKSDLAVLLGRRFKGEVVSADSRQVYRGLTIGSGKITRKEMRGVPHHLLDITDPKKTYNVVQYKKDAERAISTIIDKNKLPILCGGTGLYIDTLVGNIALPNVPPNKNLRNKLTKLSAQRLFTILKKKDPTRASSIDQHNPVRLIRAIEIAYALGKVPSLPKKDSRYNVLYIGLLPLMSDLRKRIRIRLKKRIAQGMLQEVKHLHSKGLSWKHLEALGLEYRFVARHLQGKISKPEMLKELETAIWHYAKRQMTWWKKNKEIKWFNLKQTIEIKKTVEEFLKY